MHILQRTNDVFEQYKITEKVKNSSFSIVPKRGGIVTSLVLDGREILYFDRELFEKNSSIRAGGFPILFPICGRLKDGKYSIEKRSYNLPTHGFAKELPWDVKEVDLEKGRITLNLISNENTRPDYPFDFELEFSYTLMGNEFLIEQKYINNCKVDMPFYGGFHPFFKIIDKDRLDFSIDANKYYFYQNGEEKIAEFEGKIDFNSPVDFVFILNGDNEKEYTMIDSENKRLKISASKHFKYMVMWTMEEKEFICLEPWMAPPDSMNSKRNIQKIRPGESIKVWIKVSSDIVKQL